METKRETKRRVTVVLGLFALFSCSRASSSDEGTTTLTSERVAGAPQVSPEQGAAGEVDPEEDAIVTGRIRTSLISEGIAPPLHRITVTTRDGIVTLKGKVRTRSARIVAGTIAEQTPGVSGVNNQLLYDRP